jgi:hypothetical protein
MSTGSYDLQSTLEHLSALSSSPERVAGGLWPESADDAGCMVTKAVQKVPTWMVAQGCKRCECTEVPL